MKAAAQQETNTEGKRDDAERFERIVTWYQAHQRQLTIGLVVLAVIVVGIWFTVSYRQRRETFAQRELQSARLAAEAGNLALAANDLTRLVTTYRGSAAAEEAHLVLGQVQLLQGQADLATAELAQFIADGPSSQFRAMAYGLYGAALEQTGQLAQAGSAYLEGASGPGYELVRADLLMDAGRVFAEVADTAQAVAAYERMLADFEDAPRAPEARLRLAELRQFDRTQ